MIGVVWPFVEKQIVMAGKLLITDRGHRGLMWQKMKSVVGAVIKGWGGGNSLRDRRLYGPIADTLVPTELPINDSLKHYNNILTFHVASDFRCDSNPWSTEGA